jgi:ABC-type branched-subunit amino acid transport system substrate-binding protein
MNNVVSVLLRQTGAAMAATFAGLMFVMLTSCTSPLDRPVRIAVNMPVSSAASTFCGYYPAAMSMGIEESAAKNNMSANQFLLDIQDNAGAKEHAIAIAKQQLTSRPDIYVSGTAALSSAVADHVSAANIPHLLVGANSVVSSGHTDRLRVLPHFKMEAPLYVDYAKKKNARRVFIIAKSNTAYNDEFIQLVEPALAKADIDCRRETVTFDNKDYHAVASKAKAYQPDMIMIVGFSVHISPIIGTLREYDLIRNNNVIATMDFVDMLYRDSETASLADVVFVSPSYELNKPDHSVRAWQQRFEKRFGHKPGYLEAYAYDTGCLIVEARKRSGKVTEASLRRLLPCHGVSGQIDIDDDGDLCSRLYVGEVTAPGLFKTVL